jgi:hypothetical protein
MNRSVRFLIFPLICACGLNAQTGKLYVQKGDTLRRGPAGAAIGNLAPGTEAEILEKRPNWVRVQITGWMPEKALVADSTWVAGFRIRASHILVGTEEEAGQVLRELKSGSSFESLAAKYSKDPSSSAKGGDLGEFERGDFVAAFENAAFRLKPGQTSEAVKTPLGYHIIMRTR